ncbi:hypothetical protein [Shewanella aestuarii]|uniref:Uncharacterized protein n=1 Tax=Shewanella aestuarii TaxID=1028752 RepID=A0ABT0KYQ3_9GAMM|nr:hypothetical protein [Shewanella aestuarii]MCL1116594.1 hypothetical protein [Shewanella aestuarii]GGN72265.1 hypothetical protein GCM10009193_09020 [Shewanella aestuarii]
MVISGKNKFLILGAISSASAALAHLGCIIFGGDWYRFLGAGEQMASMADNGDWYPTIVTSVIVLVFTLWALYGLSGAKVIPQLPFLKLGLLVISFIYLIRGVAFVVIMPMFPENSSTFWIVSSSICLGIGTLYSVGTFQNWSTLRGKANV